MRFQRLEIPAFGPFTRFQLDFQGAPSDLHLIHGPNEAGKSSLLRAIRALLFGIGGQSTDNFLHDYGDLRIRGTLENRAGTTLVVQRRKGNRNTLLDAEGNPAPETVLAPFLGGVDQAYFAAMFGLGTTELKEGAEALLRGEGELGSALFSASLGGTPVRRVIESLQAEADLIFKGRATTNVSIRPAAKRHQELLRASRDAIVSAEDWEAVERELAETDQLRISAEAEIARLGAELGWLQRAEDAGPCAGRLTAELARLEGLPPMPELAPEFVASARQALESVRQSRDQRTQIETQTTQLEQEIAACQVAPELLAAAGPIEALHGEVGIYLERTRELPALRSALAGLLAEIRSQMRELDLPGDPDSLEERRLTQPARLACEEAAERLEKARRQQQQITDDSSRLTEERSRKGIELAQLPALPLDDLRAALETAALASEADKSFEAGVEEVRRLHEQTAAAHRRIPGAPADWETTAHLPVPPIATVRQHRSVLEGLAGRIASEESRLRERREREAGLLDDLEHLQRQGELPTEASLIEARRRRDQGWEAVRQAWKGDGQVPEFEPGTPLEDAFPKAIQHADKVVDRLRADAETVAQVDDKKRQLKAARREVRGSEEALEALSRDLDSAREQWAAEWTGAGITSRSPGEMEAWRDDWSAFLDRLAEWKRATLRLENRRQQIDAAREQLARALGTPPTGSFAALKKAALARVREGEATEGKRHQITQDLAVLGQKLEALQSSLPQRHLDSSAAEQHWKDQCLHAGLPPDVSPRAGLDLLQQRKSLLLRFDDWQEKSRRIREIEAGIEGFETQVRTLAKSLGIEGEAVSALETSLWKSLGAARQADQQQRQLTAQLEKLRRERTRAESAALSADNALTQLLQNAGLPDADLLPGFLQSLEQRASIRTEIDRLNAQIVTFARGENTAEFLRRVRAENPDTLTPRREVLLAERKSKERELLEIRERLFGIRSRRDALAKAGDTAADLRQQAESLGASLREDGERFLRLTLAIQLLQSQVARFREENQGPLLRRSGEIFRRITRDAFAGLEAAFNDEDAPILIARRAGSSAGAGTDAGSQVPVEGLSDGTRDQLFLALRLAAMERHLEHHEPMPLILDDLLITFDDTRARALLPVLADLARRTQILLFTHHAHLVELCRDTLGSGSFHEHSLARA